MLFATGRDSSGAKHSYDIEVTDAEIQEIK